MITVMIVQQMQTHVPSVLLVSSSIPLTIHVVPVHPRNSEIQQPDNAPIVIQSVSLAVKKMLTSRLITVFATLLLTLSKSTTMNVKTHVPKDIRQTQTEDTVTVSFMFIFNQLYS